MASKNNELNTTDNIETKLDFPGKVLETKTTHTKGSNAAVVVTERFEYDHAGRLTKQTHQISSGAEELIAANIYDELGQLVQKGVGNTKSSNNRLQTVDYSYNVRGWLKQINDVTNIGNDLFSFKLSYNDPTSGTALFNGNISQTYWKTANQDSSLKTYSYSYDALNRIKSASGATTSNYDVSGISYDKNGNILTLLRNGHRNGIATIFGTMDDLTYSYDIGNKLMKVSDAATWDKYGFKDDAENATSDIDDDYTYDLNGNMKTDANKGITGITYNHLNLPTKVTINGSGNNGTIDYIYDAVGVKIKKIVNNTSESSLTTTEYAGNYIYENNDLKFFNTAEGYIEPNGNSFDYIYQYKDHLGNVRLSYADSDKNGLIDASTEIIKESNYYPFGLKHKGYNSGIVGRNHKYKYQGQELEKGLGYNVYEFELRHYDASIGRFVSTDPYEQFQSPYLAMGNNPVVSFDPDGGYCLDANGNQIACPQGDDVGDLYDDYKDSDTNHITVLDEATVEGESESTRTNNAYWAEINASAEILNKLATLNTGKTSSGRARAEEQVSKFNALFSLKMQPQGQVILDGGAMNLIGGRGNYKVLTRLFKAKSISLPALKSLTVDMKHILSGHVAGGSRVSSMKTLFDSSLSPKQVENMIKAAYKNAKKLKTQGNRVKVVGQSDDGTLIEMWVNKATKVIETAYPIK